MRRFKACSRASRARTRSALSAASALGIPIKPISCPRSLHFRIAASTARSIPGSERSPMGVSTSAVPSRKNWRAKRPGSAGSSWPDSPSFRPSPIAAEDFKPASASASRSSRQREPARDGKLRAVGTPVPATMTRTPFNRASVAPQARISSPGRRATTVTLWAEIFGFAGSPRAARKRADRERTVGRLGSSSSSGMQDHERNGLFRTARLAEAATRRSVRRSSLVILGLKSTPKSG